MLSDQWPWVFRLVRRGAGVQQPTGFWVGHQSAEHGVGVGEDLLDPRTLQGPDAVVQNGGGEPAQQLENVAKRALIACAVLNVACVSVSISASVCVCVRIDEGVDGAVLQNRAACLSTSAATVAASTRPCRSPFGEPGRQRQINHGRDGDIGQHQVHEGVGAA
jgi:hypothetical protein